MLRLSDMLKRRNKRKGIILLALICLSSSALLKICIQGERLYQTYFHSNHQQTYERRKATLIPLNVSTSLSVLSITERAARVESSCTEQYCVNLLSHNDRITYTSCHHSAATRGTLLHKQQANHHCSFINGTSRGPIALASFPGSGNTWVRGLLQLATGICTGSLYCDRDLHGHGFVGEGIYSGSVLVIKTHKANTRKVRKRDALRDQGYINFTRAIFIVRNPFDALISERNRQVLQKRANYNRTTYRNSSHLLTVGQEHFGTNREWNEFVNTRIKKWKNMIEFWLIRWAHPLLVVQYEHLKQNTFETVNNILNFISYHVNQKELNTKLKNGYSNYHRSIHANFTHYTHQQINIINNYIKQTEQLLFSSNSTNKYNLSLKPYIRTSKNY